MADNNIGKWQKDFRSFLGVKSGIILEGNIYDEYPYDDEGELVYGDLDQLMCHYGKEIGAEVVFYNQIEGFYSYDLNDQKALSPFLADYECESGRIPASYDNYNAYNPVAIDKDKICSEIDSKLIKVRKKSDSEETKESKILMSKVILRGMMDEEPRYNCDTKQPLDSADYPVKIFVLNFASRLRTEDSDEANDREMYMNLLLAINNSKSMIKRGKKTRNIIVLVVDKYNDVPAWVYMSNPNIRTFHIEKPNREARRSYLAWGVSEFSQFKELENADANVTKKVVAESDGLVCREMYQLLNLANNLDIDVESAIKIYKYGVSESPWESLESDIVKRLSENLHDRIKGQDGALAHTEEVVMRAVKGLSGLQHSNAKSKPRGVLFFAGPTGVGKTETAKTIAETIFGNEDACIRFDMSEYKEEHSDQKLFGAPPGYVGYDDGGQLTNAIRNHPFSVLLFDEIEKAHPTIMDKFLQILEDGRMTDSQGNTVYFNECIIIFTSNLGLTRPVYDEYGRERGREMTVTIPDPSKDDSEIFKSEVRDRIFNGVKDYFINNGRPEILNRLGENNIVVYDFIDKEVAGIISDSMIQRIQRYILSERGITLDVEGIKDYLRSKAVLVREKGGRGIGNMIEEEVLNPLGTFLCSLDTVPEKVICRVGDTGVVFEE